MGAGLVDVGPAPFLDPGSVVITGKFAFPLGAFVGRIFSVEASPVTSVRDKSFIYHLTALDNLASIAEHGLLSRSALAARGLRYVDVADGEILAGRAEHGLEAFVPFHFFTKNPFDYAVVQRRREQPYCALAVRRTHAAERAWLVVPRHPLSGETPAGLPWQDGLDAIDWAQMEPEGRDYGDQACRIACMAEALSPTAVAFDDVACIYVATAESEGRVRSLFPRKWVNVNPHMFPTDCR
ncbi:MAG: DUF4433 domain-containing protein [Deltaproteobacteria bacterium]|nr:MAG: DUF4433 domain-containing protein [Deltaproteobacteria bacterium]